MFSEGIEKQDRAAMVNDRRYTDWNCLLSINTSEIMLKLWRDYATSNLLAFSKVFEKLLDA